MTLDPKTIYLESPAAKKHAELVVSRDFQWTLTVALAQMQIVEGNSADPAVAAANWHRLAGARAFIAVLMNLAEPPQPSTRKPIGNLDHSA